MIGLDLGGGGEGVIGRIYREWVVAIDTRQDELDEAPDGIELKLEILLAAIPDLPARFLDLIKLGLAERPRQLIALSRWLDAFGVDDVSQQGHFSVLSLRVTPTTQARISLYVRPIEFEMREAIEEAQALQ